MLLQFTGDIDGARKVLEGRFKRWPHYGDAAVVMVNLSKQTPENNWLDYAEEQLARLPSPAGNLEQKFVRADFKYTRFKVLDDLGRMVRDPMDICFSNIKAMFGNIAPFSYSIESMADYCKQYERLCEHWHSRANELMLDASYARLVQEPDAVMREVLDCCGLELQKACLHPELNAQPVATTSSAQVRAPIHTRGLGQ